MTRHEHIADLVDAIEARLLALCTSLASVESSQATSYKDLARLIPQLQKLPAAVVVLGPVDGDQEWSAQGQRPRMVNLGVMVVSEYDAGFDEGAPDHWALLDEIHDAFSPTTDRDEAEGLPIAVLGDQDGADYGTLLIPGGYRPLTEVQGRAAGVYNLLALDRTQARTAAFPWYLSGGTPTSTFGGTFDGGEV